MSLRISLTQHTFSVVCQRLQKHDIPASYFTQWKSMAEFDLAKGPAGKLTRISGQDVFHEYSQSPMIVGDHRYKVVWEFEWNWNADKLTLLDLRIARIPVVAKKTEND